MMKLIDQISLGEKTLKRGELTNTFFRRLALVVLWLILSLASLKGWHLLILYSKPLDPPFWYLYPAAHWIYGSWPLFAGVIIGILFLYIIELRTFRSSSLRSVLIWVGIIGLSALFVFPLESKDIFGYAAFARLQVHYGINPFLAAIGKMPHYWYDVYLKNTHVVQGGSPYGPLWTWLSYSLYHLFSWLGYVPFIIVFKCVGLCMHLLITLMVYRIAELIVPGRGSYAAVLYGMNPLAIFQMIGNAHNDGPALLMFLVALFLIIKGRDIPGYIGSSLSAAFKLSTVLAWPFVLWIKAKSGKWLEFMGYSAMATIILIIMYLPFSTAGLVTGLGLATDRGNFLSNSLPVLPYVLGHQELIQPIHWAGLVVFVFCYIVLLWQSTDEKWVGLFIGIGLGYVAYYLFGAIMVHRWYYLWPLAIMLCVPDNPWTKAVCYQTVLLMLADILFLALNESPVAEYCTYLISWIPFIILGAYLYRNKSNMLQQKE